MPAPGQAGADRGISTVVAGSKPALPGSLASTRGIEAADVLPYALDIQTSFPAGSPRRRIAWSMILLFD